MILVVGHFQDVHLHDIDASDFSNVPRSSITSRLVLVCIAIFLKNLKI